jgi:hypothetical protein
MARKVKNLENETRTLCNMEYVKKHWKMCKMRNAHSRTWNVVRKMKNVENEDTV